MDNITKTINKNLTIDNINKISTLEMPDVALSQSINYKRKLDWVGMEKIEIPLKLVDSHKDNITTIPAFIDIFVSLSDPETKGIHMSRLYLTLQEISKKPFTLINLKNTMNKILHSHKELSNQAKIIIDFNYLLERKALESQYSGWMSYPSKVIISVENQNEFKCELETKIKYSSTCPCSAALARQLIQDRFERDFNQRATISKEEIANWLIKEESICATPHSQRSEAIIKVKMSPTIDYFPLTSLIENLESSVQTPVQTAVKREDEREFAKLNAKNLMFCEDACRRICLGLDQLNSFTDYYVKVIHYESLHPHDAVSSAVKGIKNGYIA